MGRTLGEDFDEVLARTQSVIPGPATSDYDTLKGRTGPLGVHESTLAANYLCNVPRQKPWRELIQTIVIADLVLMQTLYQVFGIVMGWWFGRKDRKMNWCAGCMEQRVISAVSARPSFKDNGRESEYELLPSPEVQRTWSGLAH